MSYSFAYNNGSSPSGTTKFAKLQIGGNNREYTTYGNLNWYASAPYDGKFLIVSDTYSQGWTTEGNATPTFWRTANNSLDSLKDLVNQLPEVNGITGFTTPETAMNYINSTEKYLISQESDTYNEGDIVMSGLVLNLDAGYSNSYPKSGTTWYDIKNGYNGTLTNGPTFSGGSIVFDGVDDNIVLDSYANNFSNLLVGSVSVWFKVESTQVGGTVFSISEGNDPKIISINNSRRTSNKPIIIDDDDGGSSGWNINAYESSGDGSKYRDGIWHNTCLVVGNNFNKLYMDGSELSLTYTRGNTSTGDWLFPANLDSLRVGVSRHGGVTPVFVNFFNGLISSVQVYNRTLTASEVLQNYNAQKGRFGL